MLRGKIGGGRNPLRSIAIHRSDTRSGCCIRGYDRPHELDEAQTRDRCSRTRRPDRATLRHALRFSGEPTMTSVSGWGRYPIVDTEIISPRTTEAARLATAQGEGVIARGNGRAYGDAGIGAQQTIVTHA